MYRFVLDAAVDMSEELGLSNLWIVAIIVFVVAIVAWIVISRKAKRK